MARGEVLNSAGVVDQDYGFGNKSIQDSIYVAIPSPLSRRWRADPATYRREPPGRDPRTVSGPGARPGDPAGLAASHPPRPRDRTGQAGNGTAGVIGRGARA